MNKKNQRLLLVRHSFIFLILGLLILNYSTIKQVFSYSSLMFYINLIALVVGLVSIEINYKETLFYVIAFGLLILIQSYVYDEEFVSLLVLTLLAKDLPSHRLMKISLVSISFTCLLIIGLNVTGYIPSWPDFIGERIYSSYGFTYRTILPGFLTTIVLLILYLDYKMKYFYITLPLTSFFTYASMEFCYTRTNAILLLLLVIYEVMLLLRYRLHIYFLNSFFKWIYKYSIVWISLILAFIVISTILYGQSSGSLNEIMQKLNSILSGRLNFQYLSFNTVGYPLVGFGQITDGYTLLSYMAIDNGIVYLVDTYGLFLAIPFIFFYVKQSKSLVDKHDERYMFILLVKMVEAISVWYAIKVCYTPFLFLIFSKVEKVICDE